MLVLSEIIEKLKDVLSESTIGKKVFDKDVANCIEYSSGYICNDEKTKLYSL